MKIKKTVTERVVRANRANGGKGNGPRNTRYKSRNAVTRGLLARQIEFRDEADKKMFDALVTALTREHQPVGPTEATLISEMAISVWRLQQLYGWEFTEFNTRKSAATTILKSMRKTDGAQRLPLSGVPEQGWTPQELVIRTGTRNSAEEETLVGETSDTAGTVVIAAKLTSPLETILRYQAAIKRDYYRSLGVLREVQRDRMELAQLLPGGGKANDAKN